MNADPLQRFAAGDPLGSLRADTLNALVDAAKQVRRERSRGQAGGNVTGYAGDSPYLEILVRNDTGAALDQWGIVRPADVLEDMTAYPLDVSARPLFQGVTPTADGLFAVTLEPIPEDQIGRAVILGVTIANLNVVDAGHTYASCTTATDKLTTGASGTAKIISKESGTGDKLGLVLLQSLAGAGTWSTTSAGALTAEAQTGGGTKTCDTGTDDSRGGWWVTGRQSDGLPDGQYTGGFLPYFVTYSCTSPTPDGSYGVVSYPFISTDLPAPLNTDHVETAVFATSGSHYITLTFVPVAGTTLAPATRLVIAGGLLQNGEQAFAVTRSGGTVMPGIDRDFASGDRPIVRGGIVVGYIDSGGTSYFG